MAYRIIKGKGIWLLSGSKHKGQHLQHKVKPGHYPPKLGHINFTIPSLQILSKAYVHLPNKIFPGIILPQTYDVLNKQKQHIISVDGKTLTEGLAENNLGDINLWGHEGPPSLVEAQQHLSYLIQKVQSIFYSINSTLSRDVLIKLCSLLTDITLVIKQVRNYHLKHQKAFKNLLKKCERNPDLAKKYDLKISNYRSYFICSSNFITRALTTNRTICSILSELQLTPYNFSNSDNVDLTYQMNVYRLHEYNTVIKFYDVNWHPHLVKQHTPQWEYLENQARTTGSSAFNGLCLRTLKLHQEHYNHYVNKVPSKPPPIDVQKRLKYGSDNEINSLATLVATVMPSLLSPCCIMYEEGVSFVGTDNIPQFMEVSPDGVIKPTCNYAHDCGYCTSDMGHKVLTVEVKCPYQNKDENSLPVHYQIPTYYAIQLLCQMKAKETTAAIYVCYSKESSTIFLLEFDQEVWEKVSYITLELYGS